MSKKGRIWERDETILAFMLYCLIPKGKDTINNPKIRDLAAIINRTASSVKLKLQNFKACDPSYTKNGRKGLGNVSKLDQEISESFRDNGENFVWQAHKIASKMGISLDIEKDWLPQNAIAELQLGADKLRIQKTRFGQQFFRDALLAAYQGRCSITNIGITALLRASHIKPWTKSNSQEKTNPCNGLLLNALFDAAFDKGYITVTEDYTVRVSSKICDEDDTAAQAAFMPYHGEPINCPTRFLPDKTFLEYHKTNVFIH